VPQTWIDKTALTAMMTTAEPPLIIDVRNPDEFTGPLGHIEGARNIPLPGFAARTAELVQETRPLVMVCHTDRRSSAAAAHLVQAGKADVSVLRGGMVAWRGR
jgi:rhodanese-related sulfurtransferase